MSQNEKLNEERRKIADLGSQLNSVLARLRSAADDLEQMTKEQREKNGNGHPAKAT